MRGRDYKKVSTFIPTIIRNRADVLVISIPFRKQFIFDKLWYFPISMAIFKTAPSSATTTIASLRKETVTKKKFYQYNQNHFNIREKYVKKTYANIHKTKNKVATLLVSMLYSNAWKVHKIWKNICRHFN